MDDVTDRLRIIARDFALDGNHKYSQWTRDGIAEIEASRNANVGADVGSGMVLVPHEPTAEMLRAYWLHTGESDAMRVRTEADGKRKYRTMIEAAATAVPIVGSNVGSASPT